MELSDLIGLRPVPAAGLLLTLTRRCPLSCAHCSTSSTMAGEEPSADRLLAFVGSFTPEDRPEVALLTGGEPLLRPELAAEIAESARVAGTRTALLSGMFFAREGRIPDRILRAVTAVDHFSASLDAFHEREVARPAVLRAVQQVREAGVPVSFHLTGTGPEDPYLAEVTADIRREFAGQVPMLVTAVRSVGRAAAWAAATGSRPDGAKALPCAMAAWPTVAFDGTVLACCNQKVVDRRPVPAHLRLGHLAEDGWPAVRRRSLASPVLRLLRTVGPAHLYARYAPEVTEPGYCTGCRNLPDHAEVLEGATRDGAGPVGELLDREAARRQYAAGPVELVRRHGCPPYADLVAPPVPRHGREPAVSRPSASAALRTKLDLAAPALRAATAALWRPDGLRSRYLRYLAAMHGLIRASVPLLELAADRCAELAPGDPLAAPLGRYYLHHAEEELGHDDWLLADLAAAGGDPAALARALPPVGVAELAGAQYYWIRHHHPVALLGYMAVLEGNAPAPWLAGRLAEDTGLPPAAFRTLRDHAALDGDHLVELEALLDELPLTPEQQIAVAVSALHTVDGVTRLFRRLAATTTDLTGVRE